MEQHKSQQERRQHRRRSGQSVRVSVRDQYGRVCQGSVLNVSEGGVGLFTDSLPSSELLEIQPANSTLWISVITKHFTPAFSGYVIGCAFQFPPTSEILQALYVPR
jgi:hypothetical protein